MRMTLNQDRPQKVVTARRTASQPGIFLRHGLRAGAHAWCCHGEHSLQTDLPGLASHTHRFPWSRTVIQFPCTSIPPSVQTEAHSRPLPGVPAGTKCYDYLAPSPCSAKVSWSWWFVCPTPKSTRASDPLPLASRLIVQHWAQVSRCQQEFGALN